MPTQTPQFELFEGFTAQAERAPRLSLPVQRSEAIDAPRLRRILGVSKATAHRMITQKCFNAERVPGGARWLIEYNSVVTYCDSLRLKYNISDRVLGPAPKGRRHRDADVLPFPLTETIGVPDVTRVLDCTDAVVMCLLDEGALIGYQLLAGRRSCPWRIYEPSLARYIASLHTASNTVSRSPRGSSSR